MGLRQSYNKEFKEAFLSKVLNRGDRTIQEICDQEGVLKSTAVNWLKLRARSPGMAKQSSKKWTAEDKLKVLQETHGLTEQELGAYLRKHGLHSQRLMEWRNDFIESLAKANKPVLKDERDERIKELETEVLRKDKALAEASALLILQKKVDLIWARSKEGKK